LPLNRAMIFQATYSPADLLVIRSIAPPGTLGPKTCPANSTPVGNPATMRSRSLRRAVAAFVALGLTIGSFGVASASTRSRLTAARQKLQELEARIASQQAEVIAMQVSLRAAASKVEESNRKLTAIQVQVLASRREREQIQARYQAIRTEIDKIVVNTYIRGPGSDIQSLITPMSIGDAADALSYANAIVAKQSERALEAQHLAEQLKERQQHETEVMKQRADAVRGLTADQNALVQRFSEEQSKLAELATARAQVSKILVQLRAQLRAEEIAAARAALAGGMEFGKWAAAFLGELDDPITHNNLVVLVAWETAEFTSAKWNPLATTYPMSGATTYNSAGVRNYLSLGQGLDASRLTLSRFGYGYESILVNLKRSADPMTTAESIRDSSWCGGCSDGQYVVELIPSVERYYDSYARAHA
jgi:hypothetical protein